MRQRLVRWHRFTCGLCCLFLSVSTAGAQQAAQAVPLQTDIYEVADVARALEGLPPLPGQPALEARGVEGVAELIMRLIRPASWKAGKADAATIQVIQETRLEIRAPGRRASGARAPNPNDSPHVPVKMLLRRPSITTSKTKVIT